MKSGNAFSTSYIPTAGAAVTRSADNITTIGALQATLAGAAVSIYTEAGPYEGSNPNTILGAENIVRLYLQGNGANGRYV